MPFCLNASASTITSKSVTSLWKVTKSLMDKAKADQRDPYLSLLEYIITPVDNYKSPVQLLMSRRTCSILPNTHPQLQPKVVRHKDFHIRRVQRQQLQKRYNDRSAKPMSPLHEGQIIRFQEQGYWKPAVVVWPADTERSYHIHTSEGGQEYRRNRRHLLDTKETLNTQTDEHPKHNTQQTLLTTTLQASDAIREIAPHAERYQTHPFCCGTTEMHVCLCRALHEC